MALAVDRVPADTMRTEPVPVRVVAEANGVVERTPPARVPPPPAYREPEEEDEEDVEERDDKGNVRRRTQRGSESVHSDSRRVDFAVDDGTGRLPVSAREADFDGMVAFARTKGWLNATGDAIAAHVETPA